MPLETSITASIMKYLNGLPECVAEKVMGNAYQFGRPDINACYQGKTYRIEVKTADNGNKPSKSQELNLKKWAKAGAICIAVWSLDDVKNIIEHHGCYNSSFRGWYFTEDKKIIKCREGESCCDES